jgi:DsbC/DsbD-like thiol-disulfide interchange protein
MQSFGRISASGRGESGSGSGLGRWFGIAAALAASVALMLQGQPALAAASAWTKAVDSQLRLISARPDSGPWRGMMAGIQIRLDPGWRTYWQNPGDSGVPPSFDWSGSENLKSAEVLYPAPRSFEEAGGIAFGYENEVVFPVRIVPADPDQPVSLKLKVDYGLCRNLCIPNEAKLALTLTPGAGADPSDRLLLDSFLDLVPEPAAKGSLPAVTKFSAELSLAKPKLVIETQFPAGSSRADLYLMTPDAYVPPAVASGPAIGGKKRFVVAFPDKQEAATLKGKQLTLVLVADGGARETKLQVE